MDSNQASDAPVFAARADLRLGFGASDSEIDWQLVVQLAEPPDADPHVR